MRYSDSSFHDVCVQKRYYTSRGSRGNHRRSNKKPSAQPTSTNAQRFDADIMTANGMVRLINQLGVNKGIVSLDAALKVALAEGLNVVQLTEVVIDPKTSEEAPPVCKIVDKSRFEYSHKKLAQNQHAKQVRMQPHKEVKFGTSIGGNDMMYVLSVFFVVV